MRPFRIFLILIIFLACFTGLFYIIPGTFNLPDIEVFLPFDLIKQEYKNNPSSEKGQFETLSEKIPSVPISHYQTPTDTIKIISDTTRKDVSGFIDSLLLSSGQIRIMYYGDSQLEGDRITSYLRLSLQKEYGGTGPGLILPVMPVMYTKSVYVRSSSNWERYNYLSYKKGEIKNKNLGPFMTFCRFLPPMQRNSLPEKATIKIQPSRFADKAAATYERLRLFYGNLFDTVVIKVYTEIGIITSDTLKMGNGPAEYNSSLNNASEVILELYGKSSPDIYGISLESNKGVIVDNIPQRGSAGLEFTMVDKGNLDSIYRILEPDLFILQYGLNIVKNVRNDYSYYENGLFRQLMLLKEVCPQTPVIVLSLTDMAFTENDSIKSYPNIEAIRDAQKRAASRAGSAFWDIYEEMGGKNSIVTWVNNQPPLAQKDYTHLTYTGADSLSHLLVEALLSYDKKPADERIKVQKTLPDNSPVKIGELADRKESNRILRLMVLLQREVFEYDSARPFIFTSSAFWFFFLFVVAIYSLVYRKLFIRNAFLFLVSLFFYYKSGGVFFLLLLFVIIVDYTVGLLISKAGKSYMRRFYLLISLLSNLGILAYFKYTGFFVNSFNALFGTELKVVDVFSQFVNNNFGTSFDISTIILPVGISFFTFQSISYTIDVYRKKVEPVNSIIDFGFYVSFFPQLVAGPIVRASEFIPQLYLKYKLSQREFGHALFLISKGLIKKIIISDFIATNFIDRVFDTPSLYSGFENLMAVYGYGLQIYCDFSGYTDIAIGLGLLLGFKLPINFNSPYKASSISDFWKRWHISLSRWLKDYLYIPLGGNRYGKFRTNFNLFVTMLLGGLWHGASLRFVIWGALHGFGLMVNKFWVDLFPKEKFAGRFAKAISVFVTFQFVSFCWIFFRADGMDQIILMLNQITQNFSPGSYLEVIPAYSEVFSLMLVGYIIHFLPERFKESYRGLFINLPLVLKLLAVLIIAVLLYQMKTSDIQPFIYFRF
jgi:alginate O-acetyltransferase complex protein AlgI